MTPYILHLGSSVMHRLVLITVNLRTKFQVFTFTRSKDMLRHQKLNMSHSHHLDCTHFGAVCHHKANTWYSLPQCSIWRVLQSSFSHFRDI